jgi:hypothetical protein
VLQGSDWDTAERWYEGVKEFSDPKGKYAGKEAEGWAMGGANMCKMPITLRRLITLKFEGLLEGKDWMHFLGTAQLDWACYLTLIQREIKKINENFTISFDCASPFIATAHGLVYTNAQHSNKRFSVIMDKAPDTKMLAGRHDIPFPFESDFGRRLSIADICFYAPGMLNKIGKEGKTSWDSFAYALMMGHNVECHIRAVQRANNLMDIECAKFDPDWRMWGIEGKKEKDYSEWVPNKILYFNNFVKELFSKSTKQEAFAMIETASRFLTSLEGARLQGGPVAYAVPNILTFEDGKKTDEIDFSNPDDDELRALEESVIV